MNPTPEQSYDVVVVGGAAAGLTASMYTSRRGLSTLVLSPDIGGQAALTSEIENYPGRGLVDGFELMSDFREQAERFGATIAIDQVTELSAQSETEFRIHTHQNAYTAHGVILAFGMTPKELGVPGEKQFRGRGVSTCATCDGPLFKGKTVVITGVGDSALDAVQYLRELHARVMYVCPRPALVGSKHLKDAVERMTDVTVHLNAEVIEIVGTDKLTAVKCRINGAEQTISCDGVFVEMGYVAKTDWVANLVELDHTKHIRINDNMMTSVPGIFAAGDVTTISYKQVVISAGEGAKAGLSLYKYLQEHGLVGKGAAIDWGIASTS